MSLKSSVFEKLDNAVQSADPTKVEGVQILAMAASAVKNLNEGTGVEEDVYKLGTPGEIGFGVATCRPENLPSDMLGFLGHDNILSSNYGKYRDSYGSVFYYVPKHYFKWEGNNPIFSDQPRTGYVLERSFINAGKEDPGVFIAAFAGSNENGVMVYKQFRAPLSTASVHNPISVLNTAPANNIGGFFKAVKSAGSAYYPTTNFEFEMLYRLSKAHGSAGGSRIACAYNDIAPFFPKGNLANALRDVNDTSVTFTPSGYLNCALTGSGTPFAKTTHNGQKCGIADLTGNMWNFASGFIRTTAAGFLVLKESVDVTSIMDDSSSGGAYDVSLYDVVDLSAIVFDNSGWTYKGNGSNQVMEMSTDRSSDAYKRMSNGIPLPTGVSSSGTTEFGNDGLFRQLTNEMACLRCGNWSYTSYGGPGAVGLYDSRTNSDHNVCGRASRRPVR